MPSVERRLLQSVEVLSAKSSLDIVGDLGSGRSYLLARICRHFVTRKWRVLELSGTAAFRDSPLMTLSWAGLDGSEPLKAVSDVLRYLGAGKQSLIAVDDWDDIDEASWGVLSRVRATTGVPIVTTRLASTSRQRTFLTTGFVQAYQIRVTPMRFAELKVAINERIDAVLDNATVTAVFAKTGGNIGLTHALVDASIREGRIKIDKGVAVATGDLWSPSLASVAESILATLTHDQQRGLETLAILGPVPLSVALKVVSQCLVESLADVGMIDLFPTRMGMTSSHSAPLRDSGHLSHVVTVRHPLLVEYFRHQARSIRRMLVLDDIDARIEKGSTARIRSEENPEHSVLFANLVHYHSYHRLQAAHDEWEDSRSLGSAARLLRAMQLSGQQVRDVEALLKESAELPKTSKGKLAWEAFHLSFLTYVKGDPERAIERLRMEAAAEPRLSGHLLSWAVILEQAFVGTADLDPLRAADPTQLAGGAAAQIRRARCFVLLVNGKVAEATDLIESLRTEFPGDLLVALCDGLIAIAQGEYGRARSMSRRGIEEARATFDVERMYLHAYIATLEAAHTGRYEDAEAIIEDVSRFDVPAGEASLAQIGIAVFETIIAAAKGIKRPPSDRTGSAPRLRGPFPAMAWEWGQAAEMSATGQSADAALALEKFGDRQWDLGMRLAAASSYIMAAEIHPSPARLVRLERTQEVGGAGITARRGLVVARIAQDQVRLEVGARWMEAHGAHQTALEAWKHLHDLHEQNGNMSEANRSIEEVDRILGVQLANGTVSSGARRALSTLTVREREVVSLAAAGMTNPQIAAALYVNVRTVESHVHHAMRKTGVHSRQDLRDLALNIE